MRFLSQVSGNESEKNKLVLSARLSLCPVLFITKSMIFLHECLTDREFSKPFFRNRFEVRFTACQLFVGRNSKSWGTKYARISIGPFMDSEKNLVEILMKMDSEKNLGEILMKSSLNIVENITRSEYVSLSLFAAHF